jgi:hypothetical protein
MSDLRKHLEAEKKRYQEQRYPGDLANDLLGAPKAKVIDYAGRGTQRPISIFKMLGVFGALAAAAMLALVVWMKPEPKTYNIAIKSQPTIEEEEEVSFAPQAAISMSDALDDHSIVPSNLEDDPGSIVPEYQSVTFPSIPSFSDLSTTDDTGQLNRESA